MCSVALTLKRAREGLQLRFGAATAASTACRSKVNEQLPAIFATAVTFFLIQFSAKKIGSTKVMSYTYAIPFWVAILSGLLLDNWPPPEIGIGGILIASALIFLMRDDLGKSSFK